MANEVAKLIFKAETKELERAESVLRDVGKAADKADKEVGGLGSEFKKVDDGAYRLNDELKKTEDKLKKNQKQAGKTTKAFAALKKGGSALSSKLGVVGKAFAILSAATIGVVIAIDKLISPIKEVGAEVGILNAQLKTATGSAALAGEAFDQLNAFALETPFTLSESVNGFVKLTNLGLNPSKEAMTSFANTSAAMGKSLEQMIEAVADATTMEFERLKEFGIKSRQEGDQVTFTFRGVSTVVKKEAAAIQGYLQNIGSVTFAGAALEQTKTLAGSISNLEQAIFGFKKSVGEYGAVETFRQSNEDLAKVFNDPKFAEGIGIITNKLAGMVAVTKKAGMGAFAAVVDAVTTTEQEIKDKIADVQAEIEDFENREFFGVGEHFGQRLGALRKELLNLQLQIEDLNPTQLEDTLGIVNQALAAPLTGVDLLTSGQSTEDKIVTPLENPEILAQEQADAAATAKEAEINRLKELETQFQEWKAGLGQTELERRQQEHLDIVAQEEENFEHMMELKREQQERELELENELKDLKGQSDADIITTKGKGMENLQKMQKRVSKGEINLSKADDKTKKKMAISAGAAILDNAAKTSKTAFNIQKGLSIGNAVMQTAEGITKALAKQDYAGAALTGAMGAMQIATIASQKFDDGGGGGGGSSSVGSISGGQAAGEAPTQAANDDLIGIDQAPSIVNVSVDGAIDPEGARRIIEAINEATEDGLEINAMVV